MSVDVVTFGCRLNITESEAVRREAEAAGLNDAVINQHLRGDGGGGAAGASDHPQEPPGASASADRGDRLCGTDRFEDVCRYAGGRRGGGQ